MDRIEFQWFSDGPEFDLPKAFGFRVQTPEIHFDSIPASRLVWSVRPLVALPSPCIVVLLQIVVHRSIIFKASSAIVFCRENIVFPFRFILFHCQTAQLYFEWQEANPITEYRTKQHPKGVFYTDSTQDSCSCSACCCC